MSILLAAAIVIGSVAVSVAALLLLRRRAPDGGYFNDGDRAAGIFGVLATGFSVLLGFIVFLAFANYDVSRSGAEDEAIVVAQQFGTAELLPDVAAAELSGELICYARSVVGQEWPRMEAGNAGDTINPWAVALFRTLETVEPETNAEQSAYDKWLEQTSAREQARNDRIHGAEGVIPSPLWIVLFFIAAVILVFTLFFADSGERAIVQGLLIGSVVAVMAATMLVIKSLDTPFHEGIGSIQPVAMERTLSIAEQARAAVGRDDPVPCDAVGAPRG